MHWCSRTCYARSVLNLPSAGSRQTDTCHSPSPRFFPSLPSLLSNGRVAATLEKLKPKSHMSNSLRMHQHSISCLVCLAVVSGHYPSSLAVFGFTFFEPSSWASEESFVCVCLYVESAAQREVCMVVPKQGKVRFAFLTSFDFQILLSLSEPISQALKWWVCPSLAEKQ